MARPPNTDGRCPAHKDWIGERYDNEAGLMYLNARYYDTGSALFTQPDSWDPLMPGVGTNRHGYAMGDLVNYSDPNGHAVDPGENDDLDDIASYGGFDDFSDAVGRALEGISQQIRVAVSPADVDVAGRGGTSYGSGYVAN